MTVSVSGLLVYLLTFVRLAACLFFNPVFARSNWPSMARMAFILMLTLLVAPNAEIGMVGEPNLPAMIGYIAIELLVGVFLGFVVEIFYMLLSFAGEILDSQFGLAMAKSLDPATNIQSGAVAGILNTLLVLFILVTNTHLVMIEAFARTFKVLPLASSIDLNAICIFVFTTFLSAFNFVIRLALPFVVCEFLLEVSLGILMKMIPQIHVFVINVQLKILLGLLMMVLLSSNIATFLNTYIDHTIDTLQNAVVELAK